jgi:hypothetical protein
MRRRLIPLATLAALALTPAAAGARVPGGLFAGEPVDGPDAAIQALTDLDVARDGTGALTYLKAGHVFVSRLAGGAFQPPVQVDAGETAASSQPVVAADDGGSLVVAWINGGTLVTRVLAPGATAFSAPQAGASGAASPDVDLGVDEVAYVTWTSGGDVRAARKERGATAFRALAQPLDVVPAAVAGAGTGRPRIAVPADGSAIVVWGETGHVYERRLFGLAASAFPQDVAVGADLPEVAGEDDSSFAWVVYRAGAATVARRLAGTTFDPPVTIETAQPAAVAPRIAMSGRGVGYAAVSGTGAAAYGAVLKDDRFNAAVPLGGGLGVPPFAVAGAAETGDGLVAFQQGGAGGTRAVVARPYDYVPATRAVTRPRRARSVTNPVFRPSDAARGLEAHGDKEGNIVVAFVQGAGATTRIVAGGWDRAPSSPRPRTFVVRRGGRVRWARSTTTRAPVTYVVVVGRRRVGRTRSTSLRLPRRVRPGRHRWHVVALDRHLVRRVSSTQPLLVLRRRR